MTLSDVERNFTVYRHWTDIYCDKSAEAIITRFSLKSSRAFFYSAAALLAMQSAVIPRAIPSVRLSVRLSHAGTLSRRMNIGSRGLHCEIAKTL